MDVRAYCVAEMARLRTAAGPESVLDRSQLLVVLAHFARLDPPPEAFAARLRALITRSAGPEQGGLRRAAREILRDWEARGATEPSAPEP